MKVINLRLHYPHYQQDKLVEVSEEVFDVLCQSVREMRNYERRRRYHRAYYSLDAFDWTENYALEHSPSPEQLVMLAEEQAEREAIQRSIDEDSERITALERIISRVYEDMIVNHFLSLLACGLFDIRCSPLLMLLYGIHRSLSRGFFKKVQKIFDRHF